MEIILFYIALVTLIGYIFHAIDIYRGRKPVEFLTDIPPLENSQMSKVAVIIPARNEERNMEEALQSILNLDYANLEIIIVDDRSTDKTGEIIKRMSRSNPQLKMIHIQDLPKGWLGKNHAMYRGAMESTGEYILFTDADVVMKPTILGRAIRYMKDHQLDHLALGPDARMENHLLNIFMGAFTILFGLYAKPWKARNPKSKAHIGIGAFNLVKADVYRRIGTHQAIALRPDDDIKLGKLIKKNGFKQDFLFGKGLMSVEWYSTVRELVRGLEKNSFAGVDYSLITIFFSTILLSLFFLWPFVAIFVTHGFTQIVNILILLIIFGYNYYSSRYHSLKKIYIFTFPLGVLLFIYIVWRSTILTILRDGIDWRDTHYSLKELKANKV